MKKLKMKRFLKKFKIIRFLWRNYREAIRYISNFFYIIRCKTRKNSIIQILPSLTSRDAIGNEVCAISKELSKRKINNYIVTDCVCENIKRFIPYSKFSFKKNDILIFHMSTGSKYSNIFKNAKVAKKIMVYHNITPANFYNKNSQAYKCCKKGRTELKKLYSCTDLAICDSAFNANELKKLNYKKTIVIPVFHRVDELLKFLPNLRRIDYRQCFITVGRLERHKCIDDVVKVFSCYNKKYNKESILIIIGKENDLSYKNKLIRLVKKEGLSKNVFFLGSVPERLLAHYYFSSDGYICMSEHEGFCVPLIEAMAFKIPIFAYDCTAIKETLSSTGILFKTKNYKLISDSIFNTLSNKNKIAKIKNDEYNRYLRYSNESIAEKYMDAILNNGFC